MASGLILLVEENPNDELLTLRALRMSEIKNEVMVVRDGSEALDFLFCKYQFADRDPHDLPKLVILDVKLPKVDGLEVLRRLRADPRTRLLPVVMLSSSKEEVDFTQFIEYIRLLSSYWLQLNEQPPRTSGEQG